MCSRSCSSSHPPLTTLPQTLLQADEPLALAHALQQRLGITTLAEEGQVDAVIADIAGQNAVGVQAAQGGDDAVDVVG